MMKSIKETLRLRFSENQAVCERVMDMMSLIANKTRFRILCTLAEGDFCVTDIVEIIDCGSISNVSQQLRILTLAGYIGRHKDSKQTVYTLIQPHIRELIRYLQNQYLHESSVTSVSEESPA